MLLLFESDFKRISILISISIQVETRTLIIELFIRLLAGLPGLPTPQLQRGVLLLLARPPPQNGSQSLLLVAKEPGECTHHQAQQTFPVFQRAVGPVQVWEASERRSGVVVEEPPGWLPGPRALAKLAARDCRRPEMFSWEFQGGSSDPVDSEKVRTGGYKSMYIDKHVGVWLFKHCVCDFKCIWEMFTTENLIIVEWFIWHHRNYHLDHQHKPPNL